MKKFIRIIAFVIVILLAGLVTLVAISGFAIGSGLNRRIGHQHMERIFVEDYELLKTVINYFIDSGHTSIHIWPSRDNGYMSVDSGHQSVLISDENVVNAIELLRIQGYSVIGRADNIIYFQRSTRGRHFGNGIAYSVDGAEPNYGANPSDPRYGSAEVPTQIMFLTKLEPLSKSNWFYYEEDFREWRMRYRDN